MKTPTFKPGLSYLPGTFYRANSFNPLIPFESPNVVTEGLRTQGLSRKADVLHAVKLCSEDWLENKFGGVLALLLEIQFLSQGTKDK